MNLPSNQVNDCQRCQDYAEKWDPNLYYVIKKNGEEFEEMDTKNELRGQKL